LRLKWHFPASPSFSSDAARFASGTRNPNRPKVDPMRSYAVKIFCEALEPMDTPAPTPKGTEVLIDVTRCGVCHSDLHIQEGYYDLGGGKKLSLADRGVQPPVVMGHEVLGRLVAKGPEAPIGDDMIGKTFLVYPWTGCGKCGNCLSGRDNLCAAPNAVGVHRAGGYAEMCVAPHPRHLVDVSGIDPTLAAPSRRPRSTARRTAC